MSVDANLRLGGISNKSGRAASDRGLERVFATFPILKEKLHNHARDLSGGQQQMLALGQAFMARPKFLLCDEPSLGLARALLPQILDFLKSWASEGVGIIIVEQHVEFALEIADRAILFERGAIKFDVPADQFETSIAAA
jgi:branched-chain amino acid transport system ATP-binding protein